MAKMDRIKGLKRYQHPKSGFWYVYHRKTGKRIINEWRTAAMYAEVAALDEAAKALEPVPASLGLLIAEYKKSPAWAPLAAKTRLGYERIFGVLRQLWDMPVKLIDRPFVFDIRDNKIFPKHKRWTANYTVTVLALLLGHAVNHGWITRNPLTDKVKRIRAPKGHVARNRPWAGEECRAVLEAAPPHLRLPIALSMFAGFRKTDVLTMAKGVVKDGMIAIRTSKRGVTVTIPVHPALQAALDAHDAALAARRARRVAKGKEPGPEIVHLCANSFGDPWTVSGFDSSFGKLVARLENAKRVADGLTMHGLRHTLATRLKEAGATAEQRRDILGQKSLAMAEHYAESAEMDEQTKGLVLSIDVRRKK